VLKPLVETTTISIISIVMGDIHDFLEGNSFSGCRLKTIAAGLFPREITPTYMKRLSIVHHEIYDFVEKHMPNGSFNFTEHEHRPGSSWCHEEHYPGLMYIALGLQNHDLYHFLLEPNVFVFSPERKAVLQQCLAEEERTDPVGLGTPWSELAAGIPRTWPKLSGRKTYADLQRFFLKPSLWELRNLPVHLTYPPGIISREKIGRSPTPCPNYLDGQDRVCLIPRGPRDWEWPDFETNGRGTGMNRSH